MITRRAFVSTFAGGLLAAPLNAEAQQTGTVHHTGYLSSSTSFASAGAEGFRQGLREPGRVERQNIVIDYRSAEGQFDRLPDLAAELVRLKVDIIVTVATPAAAAAKKATGTIQSSRLALAILLDKGSSRASRARAGTSRDCPSVSAWKRSVKGWSFSTSPSPNFAVWQSSRTQR